MANKTWSSWPVGSLLLLRLLPSSVLTVVLLGHPNCHTEECIWAVFYGDKCCRTDWFPSLVPSDLIRDQG